MVRAIASCCIVVAVWTAAGQGNKSGNKTPVPPAGETTTPERVDESVRALLTRHCVACHGAEKPKGGLRLDTLAADFRDTANLERWQTVLARVRAGEMPPKGKPRPDTKELRALSDWVTANVHAAAAARRAEGRTVLRRLNRVEYENTIRDLLGIDIDLKETLPLDTVANGFDNIGEALHVSSFLMDRYLEAADRALDVAIANGPQPKTINKRYFLKDERHVKVTTESVFLKRGDELVLFSSSLWHNIILSQFYPPDRGRYRFRISAQAVQSGGKPVSFRVMAGPMLMGTKNHLIGYFDVPADKPAVVEFIDPLEARSHIAILPYGLAAAQVVHKIGADKYEGPGLAVQWVEVEGPLHETWPPASHRRIFGDLPQAPSAMRDKPGRVEVVSKDPEADATRILRGFARRAFRRAVTDDDIKPFAGLVKARLAQKYSFEQAVRVGLKAVLVSPDFLFLRESAGKLDDFALASRLSYFLWSSMPDEELLTLAEQGKLSRPETLRAQVERLLKHPKAGAFTENFVGQWLSLRDIDFTTPDARLYPEFDDALKMSMVKETHLFFDELLKNDLSVTNFVHGDFTLLNERLAKHYGIGGVEGWTFRKVALTPDSHRGGVLTMASVLKVTANGTNTSPVVRGAWVLDRILGQPPARPPEGVPAVEPDIRGATTIREQLAKHRAVESCATCHAKIDPPGFALESYDVIGGWRTYYRSLGRGQAVTIDGRRMPYFKGPKVDPADVLADGRKFADIDELKQLLLREKDQLARAVAERLLTYATGAPTAAEDRAEIDTIIGRARARDYALRSLVHEVVQSKAFQSR
jgi:mono/diheme cytochrome c family protein